MAKTLGVTEFTEYIAPDGTVYKFDATDRFLISDEGLGLPPITYITQKGPYQHGSSIIDYRLGERTIQLIVRQDSCDRDSYWSNRAALLNAIRPNRYVGHNLGPGVLRKKFPDGSMRDIKVVIEQGPVFTARSLDKWDEFGYTETLRFVAHDPVFYNPVVNSMSFNQGALILSHLTFPITFPIQFSSSYYASAVTPITYTGTWHSYPTISIVGPQKSIEINNLSTAEKIFFDYSVSLGETVTINLEYGNKTVINNYGANLIGAISTDSDLSTFHIAPEPEVAGGVNNITIVSFGNNATSTTILSHYTRYIGI